MTLKQLKNNYLKLELDNRLLFSFEDYVKTYGTIQEIKELKINNLNEERLSICNCETI